MFALEVGLAQKDAVVAKGFRSNGGRWEIAAAREPKERRRN